MFAVSFLEGKQKNEVEVRVAVHVLAILNSLILTVRRLSLVSRIMFGSACSKKISLKAF